MWIVKEEFNDITIDCLTPPTCYFDGSPLKLLTSKLLNFDLEPGSGKKDAHAIDMECRCQKCGWYDPFGVPLHKRQYNKLSAFLSTDDSIETEGSTTGYITGMMINPDALGSSMDSCWDRTNDPKGHMPTPDFKINCFHCKENGRVEPMFFRYAYISNPTDKLGQYYSELNQLEYKCKKCEWIAKFLVEADREYLDKVMDSREKAGFQRNLYYMPPEEWSEDAEIKQKLKALGYW